MSTCPSAEKWQAYADSRLSADEDSSFTQHLERCRDCETSLKGLVAPLGRADERTAAEQSPPCYLIEDLCRLWSASLAPADLAAPGWWPKIDGYEILDVVGRGGTGVVYRAVELDLDREVALKMIAAGAGSSAADKQRLLNEAKTAAQLKHRHIVPVHSVSQHCEQLYCVMELLPAGSLAQRVDDLVSEPRESARLIAAVARALHHAHAHGVCHRDVKTANILLRVRDLETQGPEIAAARTSALRPRLSDLEACLTDFGLAKRTREDDGLTHTGAIVGTPGFMAPEQIRSEEATPAGDIFGLGAALYECLTGQPPFRGATPFDTLLLTLHQEPQRPRALNSRLHRDLETICLKCLEKEAPRRYPSAAALADDLERWLGGDPVRARRIGSLGRVWRRCRRYPLIAGLSAILVMVAVAGISGIVHQWHEAESARGDAEASNGEAEQLIGELIQNHSVAPLHPIHMDFYRRDPSTQALRKAEAHCRRVFQKNTSDPGRRISLTNVLGALGTLYCARGEVAEGEKLFENARELWEPLAQQVPLNPSYRDWLATTLYWQANAAARQAQFARTLQLTQEAHVLWQDLAEEEPQNLAYLQKLVDCTQTMYSIVKTETGQKYAKRVLNENTTILSNRLEQNPEDRLLRKRLAQTYLLLGVMRSHELLPREAGACWRQAYQHYKTLSESPRIDLHVRLALANCCYRLMDRHGGDPYYHEAVSLFEQSRTYLEKLSNQTPQQGGLQDALLSNASALALCHWKAGNSALGEKVYRDQVACLAARVRENPTQPLVLSELLGNMSFLASELWQLKLSTPALVIVRDAADLAFTVDVPAHDLATREAHASQLLALAATLCRLGDGAEALRLAERARHIAEGLCRELPFQPNFVVLLSGSCERIGKARWALQQPELALTAFREAAMVQRRAFEVAPALSVNRVRLAKCYDRIYYWNTLRGAWPDAAAALLDREKLWPDNAGELQEVSRDFQDLAEKMVERHKQLNFELERQRQHYLTEGLRVKRASEAVARPPESERRENR